MRAFYPLLAIFLFLPQLNSIAQVALYCDSVFEYPVADNTPPDYFTQDTVFIDSISPATSIMLDFTLIAFLPGDSLVISYLGGYVLCIITDEVTPFLAFTADIAVIFTSYGGSEGGITLMEYRHVCDFIPTDFSLPMGFDTLCPGSNVLLNPALDTLFEDGDSIAIQIRDASGSFEAEQTIASLTFPAPNPSVVIPVGLAAGTSYRFRILSDAFYSS